MEPLIQADRHFASIGIALTEKARRAVAVAIGLSGCESDCDDGSVAVGLRSTNTILSLLIDKYRLNLTAVENDVGGHSYVKEEDEYREGLRALGYREDKTRFDDLGPSDCFDTRRGRDAHETVFAGAEGEPDYETSLASLGISQVFSLAAKQARLENRHAVESFDLLQAAAKMPLVGGVFRKHRLSRDSLRNEIGRYRTLEPYGDRQQIILVFDQGKISVKSFGLLDGVVYDERRIEDQRLIVQVASPSPFVLDIRLREFEELINWKDVSELEIQRFLEKHPEFLVGDQYSRLHSQLILDRGDRGNLIPDFFAELPHSGYFDLVDLKKPNEKLIVGGKNRRGLSAAVSSAIYQLREYRDYFDNPRCRAEFYAKHGLQGWKPRIAVIIGRNPNEEEMTDFIRAKRTLFDADVLTYDDIIERARRRLLTIAGRR